MNDHELLTHMDAMSRHERKHQARWLRGLAEIDERRLYSLAGYENLWEYVTKRLRYSEGSAGKRVHVARTGGKFPLVFELIGESKISMTAVARLAPHLTVENHERLLTEACGRSVRQVEEAIAAIAPKPEVKDSMRAASANPNPNPNPAPQAELTLQPAEPKAKPKEKNKPIAKDRYHLNFTVGKDIADKQKRLQALTRHLPNGSLSMEAVFLAGLELYLKKYDPELKLKTKRPRAKRPPQPQPKPDESSSKQEPGQQNALAGHSRYISRDIRREVFASGARCAYVSPDGRQCEATTGLQIDHIQPFAKGGSSQDIRNLRPLCASHNLFAAMQTYGKDFIESRMRRRRE